MTVQARAQKALSDRLKATLPVEVVDRFVGGTHTRRFADNLLPGFTLDQVAAMTEQLGAGDGNELIPTPTGKRRAHAPYSSAALAVNAFGRWRGSESALRVDGLGGFAAPLEVEGKLQINHGGGRANLDCLVGAPGITVGIESKLTETLEVHAPVPWKAAYGSAQVAELLPAGWRDVFHTSLRGEWQPDRLGVEQLVKHALALLSSFPDDELHLVYVWWEPLSGDEFDEVIEHRIQVQELRERVGQSRPALHALTYSDLLTEWACLDDPSWIREHVGQMKARYSLGL